METVEKLFYGEEIGTIQKKTQQTCTDPCFQKKFKGLK